MKLGDLQETGSLLSFIRELIDESWQEMRKEIDQGRRALKKSGQTPTGDFVITFSAPY